MHALSKAEHEMLHLEYRRDPNLGRIARLFGLTTLEVKAALAAQIEEPRPATSADGWGRPGLRRYALQRKFVADLWVADDGLKRARAAYDQGQVEIATGRDGDWQILYVIPRKRPDPQRRPYFEGLPPSAFHIGA